MGLADEVEIWLTEEQRDRLKREAGMGQKVWRMSRAHLAAMAMLARHQGTDVLLMGPGATAPVFGKGEAAVKRGRLMRIALTEEQQAHVRSLVGMSAAAVEFALDDGEVSFREDWSSRGGVERLDCGFGRTVVMVRGDVAYEAGAEEVVIRLPLGASSEGSVFGTGSHGTTRVSLRLLAQFAEPGMRVVDVGTGSGVLSVAAVRFGAREVRAMDVSAGAVAAARETFAANGIEGVATVEERGDLEGVGGYDLLVGNLFTNIVLRMAGAMRAAVVRGGLIIVSGFVTARAEEVEAAFLEAGMRLEGAATDDRWEARAFRVV